MFFISFKRRILYQQILFFSDYEIIIQFCLVTQVYLYDTNIGSSQSHILLITNKKIQNVNIPYFHIFVYLNFIKIKLQ